MEFLLIRAGGENRCRIFANNAPEPDSGATIAPHQNWGANP